VPVHGQDVDFPRISKHYNRIAREISGITANRTADHLHTAYEYGVRYLGLPRPNPWGLERGDRYKVEHKPRYVPPEEDFWKLFEVADRQEQCILQFAFDSLARKNEILSLQPADVDLNATQRQPFGKVRLWTNKRAGGREYDWVAIDMQSTADALREQLRKTAFQKYVFVWPQEKKRRTWIDDMMPALCEKAEVKPFGLHGIRHLGACLLDDDGVPLVQIQSRLRHKSATTTAKYLHDLRGVRPPERKTAKVVPLKQLAPGAANTEGEK
jgi:integrase